MSKLLGCFVGLACITTVSAQGLRPWVDPICGLPGLRIDSSASEAGWFRIQSSSGVSDDASWETLTEMAVGAEGTAWRDLSGHRHGQRFFRLEKLPIRPPLNAVDNFRLIDQDGKARELFRAGEARAWVLVFTDNASLQASWEEWQSLQNSFAGQGVRFWFINPFDDRGAVASQARTLGLSSPFLHDRAQLVARAFQSTSRHEVLLVRGDDLTPVYRGALSEICSTTQPPVAQHYLAEALTALLKGTEGNTAYVRPLGAAGQLQDPGSLDYARDIAPIFQAKCVHCHREGDIGSFAMTNHAILAEKAWSIRRDVITGDMPPWHVDPQSGRFSNDFSLTPAEATKLVAWVEAGAPRGTGADPLVEHPVAAAVEWPLGEPDYKIRLEPQSVPAEGTVDYRYLIFQNPLPTNAWLRATVVKPGNRSVVHHVLAFAGSVGELLALKGGLGGYFAAFVPGMDQTEYPGGTGKLLRKGSWLVFQMHYTTNGRETTDATEIGLYFAKQTPARELKTTAAYNTEFVIPARAMDHEVKAETAPFAKAVDIYEVGPHMHYRGLRMRFEVVRPDGSVASLASIPAYQFDWQTVYRLAEPLRVPAGSRVRIVGGFDNSPYNPRLLPEGGYSFNASVRFGEQSWEEMLIGYVNYSDAP